MCVVLTKASDYKGRLKVGRKYVRNYVLCESEEEYNKVVGVGGYSGIVFRESIPDEVPTEGVFVLVPCTSDDDGSLETECDLSGLAGATVVFELPSGYYRMDKVRGFLGAMGSIFDGVAFRFVGGVYCKALGLGFEGFCQEDVSSFVTDEWYVSFESLDPVSLSWVTGKSAKGTTSFKKTGTSVPATKNRGGSEKSVAEKKLKPKKKGILDILGVSASENF